MIKCRHRVICFFCCDLLPLRGFVTFANGVTFFVMFLNFLVNRLKRFFYQVNSMCCIILMPNLNAMRPHILKLSNI